MGESFRLRWAILGTGKIARIFGESLRSSETGELWAVASRTSGTAERVGAELGAQRTYGSYLEALQDPNVDVVYIATPHPTHAGLIESAARAGKHVLCEKPLTVNAEEARAAITTARENDVFLMEGFAFRFHPQTEHLISLLRTGSIGEPRMISAWFGYDAGPNPTNYLLRRDLAGGAILDVGCYTVAMSRLIAGAVSGGSSFDEPRHVSGAGDVSRRYGVDHRAVAVLAFAGGLTAQVSCAIDTPLGGGLSVVGSDGSISLTDPWLPGKGVTLSTVLQSRAEQRTWTVPDSECDLYANEADEVARWLDRRESPAMSLNDSLGNMETLDAWRRALGLAFAADGATASDDGA